MTEQQRHHQVEQEVGALRKRLEGMNLSEVARLSGIPRETIRDFRSGDVAHPTLLTFRAIECAADIVDANRETARQAGGCRDGAQSPQPEGAPDTTGA